MRSRKEFLVIAGAFALIACNRDTDATKRRRQSISVETTETFIQLAAANDNYAILSGQLAIRRARTEAVRLLAYEMVRDHRTSAQTLMRIVGAQESLRAPSEAPDPIQMDLLARLRAAGDANFDVTYFEQQRLVQTDALHLHQRYARYGDNQALRVFASDMAQVAERHLNRMQNMEHTGDLK